MGGESPPRSFQAPQQTTSNPNVFSNLNSSNQGSSSVAQQSVTTSTNPFLNSSLSGQSQNIFAKQPSGSFTNIFSNINSGKQGSSSLAKQPVDSSTNPFSNLQRVVPDTSKDSQLGRKRRGAPTFNVSIRHPEYKPGLHLYKMTPPENRAIGPKKRRTATRTQRREWKRLGQRKHPATYSLGLRPGQARSRYRR